MILLVSDISHSMCVLFLTQSRPLFAEVTAGDAVELLSKEEFKKKKKKKGKKKLVDSEGSETTLTQYPLKEQQKKPCDS